SRGRLGKFESILFYHEGNSVATSFQQELRGLSNQILVVGGGDTTDILKAMGLNYKAFQISGAAVRFTYAFSEGKDSSGLINADRAVILQGEFPYRAGYIEAGGKASALCSRAGRFNAMGVFDCKNNILKAALTDQISKWKWPYENLPHSYPQYIVYDNVFPFFSNERMLKVVEMMAGEGIPYSITVMPVYQNSEYPAMKHFCETLRYAQAKGASIILKAPIINTEKPSLVEINKRLTAAVAAYNKYGVYPIAIEAPNNWIHEKMGLDILRRFRTVVLYSEDAKNNWSDIDGYNTVYSDGHHLIAPALPDGDIGKNLINAYSTALFLDMNADIGTLKNQIEQIQGSEVPLKSLWSIAHTVYTDDRVVKTEGNILTVNGKVQSLEYTPFTYTDNFNYNRGVIGRLAESMARENKRLLIIVTGISVLFIIFIAVARYQNRRRFLYKRKSEPKSNKEGAD
ncbi:MAG TPA: DUF2334 domain-containing protein, partial [Ruminiclostridium sp.]|nr:DUF2334 domain-containing protein [Ruminiclostridium sp.]